MLDGTGAYGANQILPLNVYKLLQMQILRYFVLFPTNDKLYLISFKMNQHEEK